MLLQSFIDNGLWDEAFVEEAPFRLGGGVKAPCIENDYQKAEIESFGHRISQFLHEKHIF
jgi:diaminohydroxyphosphoribosylaminopyrimidine deaminase/5-amino-6-(5-phosphoribosylamino)uracil reductase